MNRKQRRAAAKIGQTSNLAGGSAPSKISAEANVFLQAAIQHHDAGQLGAAELCYRRALAVQPDRADVYCSLGEALSGQRRFDDAVAAYRKSIAIKPDFAEAHYNLGNALKELGKSAEAAACYRQAIAFKPDFAEAYSNLGNSLSDIGMLDEAIAAYRQAIRIRPHDAELHYNLGTALKDQNRLGEAATAYRDAIKLNPDHAEAHANLGIVFMGQGKIDDALAEYRQAISIKPDNAEAYSNFLLCLNYDESATPERVYAEHREWNERYGRRAARIGDYANDRTAGRRLRIGYVSPDLRDHSAAYFFEPLLREHDRQAVELFCYAEVFRPDKVSARLQKLSDHWAGTVGMSDDALAEQIRADKIDILVDLAGHTAFNRLPVFTRKPAPVQVTWLGYPATTGLTAIDYRLVDAVTDPAGTADAWASESLLRLEGCFLCYGAPKDAPEPTAPPSLKSGIETFGSFNNPAKVSAATLDAWARLLVRRPQARLLMKGKPFVDEATRALFLARLSNRGIEAERVELHGWLSTGAAHLALYNQIDIALDPFPYNGTTTTCEALWMGVPVVTLRGDRHSGRVGASLLSQLGLDDTIAGSVDEYVEIANTLAGDSKRLHDLRRSLRPRIAASRLCNGKAFARKMETAFRKMWQKWCEAQQKLV